MIDSDVPKTETDATPRRSLQDHALILFYAVLVLIAMSGWIWLLIRMVRAIFG
jgi:hypothetical protein